MILYDGGIDTGVVRAVREKVSILIFGRRRSARLQHALRDCLEQDSST
jgi:hypothetical protein